MKKGNENTCAKTKGCYHYSKKIYYRNNGVGAEGRNLRHVKEVESVVSGHQTDVGQKRSFWFEVTEKTLMLLYDEGITEYISALTTLSGTE